jgi:hypothetical protein
MKRALLLIALAALVSGTGCHSLKKKSGCEPYGAGPPAANGMFPVWQQHHDPAYFGPQPGAPSAPQATYPYYTTRGPRDFLAPSTPPIGG